MGRVQHACCTPLHSVREFYPARGGAAVDSRTVNGSGGSRMDRRSRASRVDAVGPPSRRGLPFEAEEGVAQRKGLALSNAPFLVPALSRHRALLTAPIGLAHWCLLAAPRSN